MKSRARSTAGDSRYDSIWPPLSTILVFLFVVLNWICLFFLKALGEEDQGREGPKQAQEASERVLRLHGGVQEGLQGEAPQCEASLRDWQGWW
ncbi:High mobility group B protein 2 [Zea mays]|uniref:High mobility group B protein 2 n=1 Tax=Zea mays TaxID=4577 RepID=A0A1D6IAX7_MAIZE|nr:High mobility group B protein 2 [Zea mays]